MGWQQRVWLVRILARAYKSHQKLFDVAVRVIGCTSGEAVHIGDFYDTDMVGAHNMGIRSVLLLRDVRGNMTMWIPQTVWADIGVGFSPKADVLNTIKYDSIGACELQTCFGTTLSEKAFLPH